MSKVTYRVSGGGVSIFTVLTVVFIVMKLMKVGEVADWPWFSANPFIGSVFMFLITWPVILVVIGIIITLLIGTIEAITTLKK